MKAADLAFMGQTELQAAVVRTLTVLGFQDDPAIVDWDDEEPTIYVATDLGILKAVREGAAYGQFSLKSQFIRWPEVSGAGIALAAWVHGGGGPTVTFSMANPEMAVSETADGNDKVALIDFAKVCMRRQGTTG